MLDAAWMGGVRLIDTSASYGETERRLGNLMSDSQPFDIVSKPPHLSETDSEGLRAFIENAAHNSLANLKRDRLKCLMLRNADELHIHRKSKILDVLFGMKRAGMFDQIGISLYRPDELDIALEDGFDLIQIPVSILDQRFVVDKRLRKAHEKGIEIHARSAFLQGILTLSLDRLPTYFHSAEVAIIDIQRIALELGVSVIEAAVGFCHSVPEVDYVIIGAERADQVSEFCVMPRKTIPYGVFASAAISDETLLLPANWPIRKDLLP